MVKEGGKRKRTAESPFDRLQGWQKVEIGDELLIGSEESGFLELEEFTPASGSNVVSSAAAEEPASPMKEKSKKELGSSDNKAKKKKALRKVAGSEAPVPQNPSAREPVGSEQQTAGRPVSDDVAQLKAQLARLQAENQRLKEGKAPGKAPDPNSARTAKIAAKRAKAKEVRQAKKEAAKARKLRVAARVMEGGVAHALFCPLVKRYRAHFKLC